MTIAKCDPHTVTVFRGHRDELIAVVCDLEPVVPTATRGAAMEQVVVRFDGTVGDPDTFGKVDTVTCRQHVVGRGGCNAVVPLPPDGALPQRCPYGHRLPWHGTLEPTAGPVL